MTDPARIVANAIRAGARRDREKQGQPVARAVVTSADPLELDLLGADLTLDEDDLEFAHGIDQADLAEDDVVLVVEVDEGDWIVTTIVSTGGA